MAETSGAAQLVTDAGLTSDSHSRNHVRWVAVDTAGCAPWRWEDDGAHLYDWSQRQEHHVQRTLIRRNLRVAPLKAPRIGTFGG